MNFRCAAGQAAAQTERFSLKENAKKRPQQVPWDVLPPRCTCAKYNALPRFLELSAPVDESFAVGAWTLRITATSLLGIEQGIKRQILFYADCLSYY